MVSIQTLHGGTTLTARACRSTVVMLLALLAVQSAFAWGPHPDIARAALNVLPEAAQCRERFGSEFDALTNYSWMPDQQGQELGAFYADDYLLIPAFPKYAFHAMPGVADTYEPFLRRALQAFRTETPANACRQLGPLVHFVEDTGAPPHALYISGPLHGPMENWVNARAINIEGYQPVLLGTDDESLLAGLRARMDQLVAFAIPRAEKAKPLCEKGEAERPNVEPILLECANECARALADVLHSIFRLVLNENLEGAGLEGNVIAGEFHLDNPKRNNKGARVVLLDAAKYEQIADPAQGLNAALTAYSTVAYSAASIPEGLGWLGEYRFRNLPDGVYRVLACRPGSTWTVSDPVALTKGQIAQVDLALPPTDPPGNILQNPTGTLSYLAPGPDRWGQGGGHWSSRVASLDEGVTYRCGAVLKDPTAKVSFRFATPAGAESVALAEGTAQPAEVTYTCASRGTTVSAVVDSARQLTQVLERVWVVPVVAQ